MISRTCALLAVCAAFAHAQQDVPPDSSKVGNERGCHWRAWVVPAREGEEVSFVAKAPGANDLQTLAASKGGERQITHGYSPAKPGLYQFGIISPDQRVLAKEEAALTPGFHYTVAAVGEGTGWKIRVFQDGPAPPGQTTRPVRVFNFSRGRSATLDIGQKQSPVAKVPADGVAEFTAPAAITGLTIRVLAPDGGPPAQSSLEVDFASVPSAYIVVSPDYRGRMRPQVIEGGPAVETAAPAQ